jgi:proteasome accessory factor A
VQTRVFGTECEYALVCSPDDGESRIRRDDESLLEHLKRLTPFLVASLKTRGHPFAGEFLGNGGRFYIDRGAHPEYATPECAAVRDVVAHEKAGDRIVQELGELASSLMADAGKPGKLRVFKNNVDSFGNTYGTHENYLVTPQAMENIRFMVPFLVTRQVFSGAGKVTAGDPQQRESPYQLTQRADFIDRVFSDRTSQVRGIINLRKREIPRHGQNIRLHVLVGDSNMSEYSLGLRIGTTALVLRLLEEDSPEALPVLASSVNAMKDISRLFHCPIELEHRRGRYNALDVQEIYLGRVHRFFEDREPSSWEKEILDLWNRTLIGLRGLKISPESWTLEDDPQDLRRRIDWIVKLWLINRAQLQGGLDWRNPRLRLLDVTYHDLDPGNGLFQRCQSLDLIDRMVDEQEIRRAQIEPPQGTRAWIRGTIIQHAWGKNVEIIVKSWENVLVIAKPESRSAAHPFDRHRRMVNRLEIKLEDPLMAEDASELEKVMKFADGWN